MNENHYTLDPHGRVACKDCGASEHEGLLRHSSYCSHSAKQKVSVRPISLRAQSGARDAGWLRAATWALGQLPEGEDRAALVAQVAAEEPKIRAAASAPKAIGRAAVAHRDEDEIDQEVSAAALAQGEQA